MIAEGPAPVAAKLLLDAELHALCSRQRDHTERLEYAYKVPNPSRFRRMLQADMSGIGIKSSFRAVRQVSSYTFWIFEA
jgi:hypothetical protein